MLETETSIQTNIRQSLIQEIEQTSDSLLSEVLDFLLFVKAKHSQAEITVDSFDSEEIDDRPKQKILEDLRQSLQDAKEGRVHDISQLWDGIDV